MTAAQSEILRNAASNLLPMLAIGIATFWANQKVVAEQFNGELRMVHQEILHLRSDMEKEHNNLELQLNELVTRTEFLTEINTVNNRIILIEAQLNSEHP